MRRGSVLIGGAPVTLGARLGRGGEGEVRALACEPSLAVKLYDAPDPAREAKVRAMIAAGIADGSELVAFPAAVAETADGRFLGFAMRRVAGCEPLFELYAPGPRKRSFPQADYRFLVRAAANIARAVARVHASGAVIGDINHSGILVGRRAIATLIDADSFQFGAHRCRVGTPEYTPPELQGTPLAGIVRTPAHDGFGLAVLLFQLLMMGRHPYVGRWRGADDMPVERAIAEHRFAYSGRANHGLAPPPAMGRLTDLPAEVAELFEEAFGHDPRRRPAPAAWIAALGRMEAALVRCAAVPRHWHSPASACPWCRIEAGTGVPLFPPADWGGDGSGGPPQSPFDLAAVWAAIEEAQGIDLERIAPPLPHFVPQPSPAALAAIAEYERDRLWGLVAVVGTALLIAAFPVVWTLYLVTGGYGLAHLFGRFDTGVHAWRRQEAERAYERALASWRERMGAAGLVALRRRLEQARTEYLQLAAREDAALAALARRRQARQRDAALERIEIGTLDVPGIGAAETAALAAVGIVTAADAQRRGGGRLPGLSAATAAALRARIAEHEAAHPATDARLSREDVLRVRRRFASRAAALRKQLRDGPAALRAARADAKLRLASADDAVSAAYLAREQARFDVEHLAGVRPSLADSLRRRTVALRQRIIDLTGGGRRAVR